jgi:hypothetical protein
MDLEESVSVAGRIAESDRGFLIDDKYVVDRGFELMGTSLTQDETVQYEALSHSQPGVEDDSAECADRRTEGVAPATRRAISRRFPIE